MENLLLNLAIATLIVLSWMATGYFVFELCRSIWRFVRPKRPTHRNSDHEVETKS